MGRKPKFHPAQKKAFLQKIEAGSSVGEAAQATNVSVDTAEKWERAWRKAKTTGSSSSTPPATDTLERGTVPKPQGQGGAAAGSGAGGADAAARAAGIGGASPNSTDPSVDASTPKPETPPLPPGEALVHLSMLAVSVTTRAYCVRYKVPFDDQAKDMARLTPGEREDLEKWAPYAEPLLGEWLTRYGKYIGAGIYVFMLHGVLSDRVAYVKDRARKTAPARNGEEREDIHPEDRPRPERGQPAPGMPSNEEILRTYAKELSEGRMPTMAPAARQN